MAEAHSAVAFSLEVTHEGVDVNFDWEVLKLIWQSGIRSWKKRITRFQNGVKAGVYPAPLYSLAVTCGFVSALRYAGYDITLGLTEYIKTLFPGDELAPVLTSDALSGVCLWLGTISVVRFTLKSLFKYKGWIYEERAPGSKISKSTRLWASAVKLLSGSSPMLYSFQASLPALPLPNLKVTMRRYLRSVRPLLNDEEYSRMEMLTAEFQNGIGKKLQRYLVLKYWWSSNYVSDWWEEYVYLRGRSPLMVNSNFYGIDAILTHPTRIQTARAANAIYGAMLFRKEIEEQTLKPILIQNVVPLCSWQYERLFNTTRIPGIDTDKILHLHDSLHIVVLHEGRYFKMQLYHNRKLLSPADIEKQLQRILENTSLPVKGEERLAALTASDRVTWAKTRSEFFKRGINRISLDAIEKAAFVVVLDNVDLVYDPSDPGKLDQFGRSLLHGKGCDRWFDKSFNLVVGKNGRIGLNAEHSWADAPIIGHMWEYILASDIIEYGYAEDGHTHGQAQDDLPAPLRLTWEIPKECVEKIDTSYEMAQVVLSDVDLRLYVHDHYGKGFMKTCRISPDAYIQMALQLAYFRDAGKFNLTYEASMTRLYREGRTETVRPCTVESCAFVKSVDNQDMSAMDKIKLLRKASTVHQQGYQDAMCGKGIDRHLFCLYVVSKYLEVDSPFLKEVLSEPWRLSTSQTPHGQTSKLDLRKHPHCISAGGGFGPVADDGYGVSYIIAGENLIFFHVSSKKSSPETDSPRFARQIERALADIRNLFESVKGSEGKSELKK